MRALRKKVTIACVGLALSLGLFSCEDTIGTNPRTVPGLFVDWELIRVDRDCTQSGFNSSVVEKPFELKLKQDFTFSYGQSGADAITGEFIIDNENITFIPPIYPESISTTHRYGFGGRNMVINTTEFIPRGNGDVETCEVKRLFLLVP